MMSSSYFNKKALLNDTITIFIGLLSFIVVCIFCYIAYSSFNEGVQNEDQFPAEAKAAASAGLSKYKTFDTAFAIIWIGLFMAALLSGWFIDTYPAFFIFSLLGLIMVFVAFMPMVNMLQSFLGDASIVTYSADFPVIVWFTNNFFTILVVQGMIMLINIYAKMRAE